MLRRAVPADAGFVRNLWTAPDNALWLDPPEAGQIETATVDGRLLIWQAEAPAGFALLTEWMEGVWSLREFAVTGPGLGRPFLSAVLADVFAAKGAHRLGLDVTVDNARALRFFEAAGFRHEGVWRECWKRPGGDWADCAFLSMLDREWRDLRPS